jgi:hypothetical protein
MFGKFFDTAAVDALVAWVVQELTQALPPAALAKDGKQTAKRREQVQERVRRRAEALAGSARLNVYQKAQLGLRLRTALETAGYDEAFAKPFAHDVMSLVTVASSRR